MATGNFSAAEWKQVVNAPQLIYHLLVGRDKAALFTKRGEARALEDFLKTAKSQSPLVQQIIAAQKDADAEIDATPEQARSTLAGIGNLIESKTDVEAGDAIRDFLMDAAQAVAEAEREKLLSGQQVSAAEQETLAAIATALKATEADKRRRRDVLASAEALRQAEAQKKADEAARQKREAEEKARLEAEARKQAEEARAKREAETREMMEEARRKREEDARKAAEGQAAAKKAAEEKAAADKAQAEAAARKAAEEKAAAAKAQAEAEALKAEAREREAAAAKPAAAVTGTVTAKAAPKGEERIYVVKKGDTLSGIAEEVYGNAGRWKEIFEANRDVIDKPNLIRPGWKLRIP